MSTKSYDLAVLPGDGIGPEVVDAALHVIDGVSRHFSLSFQIRYADVGGAALDKQDNPLPPETLELCRKSDAVLLGAIGGPKWDDLPSDKRPERGLLGLRDGLGLYANLRPARVYGSLKGASTLKSEVIDGIDLLIVRELTGGIYFGQPSGRTDRDGGRGFNTMVYTRAEVERIARVAFEAAAKRRSKVTSVDKANVLVVSQLWRSVVTEVARDYPATELNHMYVDNCAMQLVRCPKQFDVILTGNLFGDILSDEAAMLTGSLGMLPSASLGQSCALYEPVHGSAPDIAGQGVANPIAMIASVAMMFRHSFGRPDIAEAIEGAIELTLQKGCRTADIADNGASQVTTSEMAQQVVKSLSETINTERD